MEAHFPEWTARRPKYWKGLFKARDLQDTGLFRRSSAEVPAPLFRFDPETGARTQVEFPRKVNVTPQPGIEEIKERMRLVTYKPRYNGVFNSRLAHLPRRDPNKIDIATRTLKETPSYSRSAVAALA